MSEFNIDPTFSVYRLVNRSPSDTAVMSNRRTMSIISREIENASIVDCADNVIFSSFQYLSKFLPQEQRYRQLAQKAQQVYVFGVPDTEMPYIEGVTYVPLKPTDQLAKEWFLVSYGRDYFSALATEELTNFHDPDHARKFRGVWTFDLAMVNILHEWLSGIVGLRIEQRATEQHDFDKQFQLLMNTIGRMDLWLRTHQEHQIEAEIRKIVDSGLQPILSHMQVGRGGQIA